MWIGAGVRILDGVIVRKGCIIGASSVLTKSTEEYGVYIGVPAKKIRNRKKNKSQKKFYLHVYIFLFFFT